MPGTRSNNTMVESLRGMLSQIAEMKSAPDADIAFLNNVETQVLKYLRAPFEQMQAQQQMSQTAAGVGSPAGGAGAAADLLLGGGGGAVPGMASGGVAMPPGLAMLAGLAGQNQPRVPGVMRGASMPVGDELRRMLMLRDTARAQAAGASAGAL